MAFYSKIYANTVAKYNEGLILPPEKLKRLSSAGFSDALKMLEEFGYGGTDLQGKNNDIDAFITAETLRLIEFIKEVCPGDELKSCLINKFLYSDAKVIYKSRYMQSNVQSALYGGFEGLKEVIDSKEYSPLPVFMAEALRNLDEKFEDSLVSPRKIDVVLTRAMFADNVYNAKASRNRLLKKYITAEIDFNNIQTAFRCLKLGLKREDFLQEFVGGGTLNLDIFDEVIEQGGAPECALYSKSLYGEIAETLSKSYDFIVFERDADEALHSILSQDGEKMTSLGPFINYFLAKTNEFKAVKMILVCIKNNTRDEFRKRYGVKND